ncbi:hypothetical protein TNCT_286451, partial [Trichonephila clavata]
MVQELNVSVEEHNVVNVKKTKGILKRNQTCTLDLKVGILVRSVRFFKLNTDLGLESCIEFQLVIHCVKQVVVQKERNLINFSSSECSDLSLHINPEIRLRKAKKEMWLRIDGFLSQLIPLLPMEISEIVVKEPPERGDNYPHIKKSALVRFQLTPVALR